MPIQDEVSAHVKRLKHYKKSLSILKFLQEMASVSKCINFWTLTVKQARNLHFVTVAMH